jgi:hypothetical protein
MCCTLIASISGNPGRRYALMSSVKDLGSIDWPDIDQSRIGVEYREVSQ